MIAAGIGTNLNAQCPAVDAIDETFDAFTTFPENCWNASGTSMNFYLNDEETGDGKEVMFYGFTGVGSSFYLVTPELSNIDGNHYLTFEGEPMSALGAGLTIQFGTMESTSDFASFVPHGEPFVIEDVSVITYESILIPEDAAYKHMAIMLTTSASHQSLKLDNFHWVAGEEPEEECDPITELDEDFQDFASFPEHCWTTSHEYPFFSLETSEDNFVQFYAMSAAGTYFMATPELTDIDGAHQLTFKAKRGGTPGDIHIQIGTLSEEGNFETFVAHGDVIAISSTTESDYSSVTIPAGEDHKYVCLKINATSDHQSLDLDDFKWETTPSGIHNVSNVRFSLYPNPASGSVHLVTSGLIHEVSVTDITGKVAIKQDGTGSNKIDLNVEHLNPGIYFVHIVSNEGVGISKLIIR